MTRAYVLDPVTRATLGLVDQSWERLSYVRRYAAMDTFELVINRTRLWASELATKRLLYLPDEGDLVFLIEQIASVAEGSTRNDEMTVTGRSLEGIAMAERLVEPPAGESHDRQTGVAAETAIKHYLRAHAGDLASPARQVPGLVVAADAAQGVTVTAAGRFQTVLDLVREIGLLAGLGWEILYDPGTGDFRFDVTVGIDRSASVFFDFAFETLERTDELDSVIDAKTVALVAGQGEGTARDLVTRWSGAEPTGFERREAFLDARDVELGATTLLEQRGDAFLAATGAETSLEADVHQYGGFRYREHWDVGDLVTVRNAERALSYPARVVEVAKSFERSAAAPTVRATLGRPFPTLASQASSGRAAATADLSLGASIFGIAAGGDLSGMYPDPTVDDDSHAHTSATVSTHASAHSHASLTGIGANDHHPRAHDHANAGDGTALAPASLNVAGTVTVGKNGGTTSHIAFPAQTNDPGHIKHIENSNVAELEFSASDDRGSGDRFTFGAAPGGTFSEALAIRTDGALEFSGTAEERDTNLYRAAANRLKTDDTFEAAHVLADTFSCRVTRTTTQALAAATWTAIGFNAADTWDTVVAGLTAMHDTVTNNTRIYARRTGKHRVRGKAGFASNAGTGANGRRILGIGKNGATPTAEYERTFLTGGVGVDVHLEVNDEMSLVAGDYIEVYAWSAVALNVQGSASGFLEYLGD